MTKVGRILDWEDHSVNSNGFLEDHDPESENSSDEDLPSDEEVVQGAKPYRFEPLAPARCESEHGGGDTVGVHDDDDNPATPANIACLNNADR